MTSKKFTIFIISILIISIITSVLLSKDIYDKNTQNIINNNAYIIDSLIKNHPELETEIIKSIINNNKIDKGYEVLKKYGLEDINNIAFLNGNKEYKILTIKIVVINIIIILVLILIFYIYIKNYSNRIKKINEYMYNILNGDYSLDIREYNEGEISTLKNDIYKITTILKDQTEKANQDKIYLKNILSDISHQIKTPLTSMYVINDLLSNDSIDSTVKKEFLNKNRKQLERMEWLVSSLLKMSRLDSGSVILKRENINLKKLLLNALEPIKIMAELKEQTIEMNVSDNIEVDIDYHWTLEAITNIIKNSCEHTPEKGTIKITANSNHICTEITIADNGEGISKEDLPRIFERFYKGKSSNKESIGIGLNMAQKIINKQNGEITVHSIEGKETIFHIKLYKITI